MNKVTVYLKDNKTIEVELEDLGEFLHNNQDVIDPRKKKVRRAPIFNENQELE